MKERANKKRNAVPPLLGALVLGLVWGCTDPQQTPPPSEPQAERSVLEKRATEEHLSGTDDSQAESGALPASTETHVSGTPSSDASTHISGQ